MRMKWVAVLVLAVALSPALAVAGSHPIGFLGGGVSGTTEFGYQGGWGVGGGAEFPINPHASFLLRTDYQVLPNHQEEVYTIPLDGPIGQGTEGLPHANLFAALMGLRLQPANEFVRPYVDVMAGLGRVTKQTGIKTEKNLALSLGAGLKFMPIGVGGLFADVHFDFYDVTGLENQAVIPIRVGLLTR